MTSNPNRAWNALGRLLRRMDEAVSRQVQHRPAETTSAAQSAESGEENARRQVRDRYIAARFPGVARFSADLARVGHVVKSARLYYEDGNIRRAEELLDLACTLQPQAEPLWLARLELALRLGDAEAYRATALAFLECHPATPLANEVFALGRSLCLSEEPFAAPEDEAPAVDLRKRKRDWLQNWWDIAPEAVAADVRARILEAIEEERITV